MTNCIWTAIRVTDELSTYQCPKCRRTHTSKYPPSMIHRNCLVAVEKKRGGPGTLLARILKLLGIKMKRGCGCDDWEAWMNELGWRGCWRERSAIAGRLKEAKRYNRK